MMAPKNDVLGINSGEILLVLKMFGEMIGEMMVDDLWRSKMMFRCLMI